MARFAAVVLAAGASRRFGPENKLCAAVDGEALIRRVVTTALEAGISDVVIVTGNESDQVAQALEGLTIRLTHNPDWETGMGTSIAAGIAALADDIDGAFIVPGDMPFLDPALFRTLAGVFEQNEFRSIVYPVTISGEQRNPVLWPCRYFSELRALPGHKGAKELLRSLANRTVTIPFGDDMLFADIDNKDDLAIAQRNLERPA